MRVGLFLQLQISQSLCTIELEPITALHVVTGRKKFYLAQTLQSLQLRGHIKGTVFVHPM